MEKDGKVDLQRKIETERGSVEKLNKEREREEEKKKKKKKK